MSGNEILDIYYIDTVSDLFAVKNNEKLELLCLIYSLHISLFIELIGLAACLILSVKTWNFKSPIFAN